MVITGPQYVRNDLRSDLLKLDLLRSYPLRGWSVVLAEASASTLMLTLMQIALLGLSYLAFLGNQTLEPGLQERTLLLLLSLVFLPPINLLGMLIQNGAALLYPAWVRVGAGRPGGVETLGQNLLMVIAFAVLLALTLLIPAALAGGSYLLLRPGIGEWALIPAGVPRASRHGIRGRLDRGVVGRSVRTYRSGCGGDHGLTGEVAAQPRG